MNAYRATLDAVDTTRAAWTFLSDAMLTRTKWEAVMAAMMAAEPVVEDEEARLARLDRQAKTRGTLDALLESATNRTTATAGTMFGALNAVTEWVDHVAGRDAGRWQSATFGAGAALKRKAFYTVMALAS